MKEKAYQIRGDSGGGGGGGAGFDGQKRKREKMRKSSKSRTVYYIHVTTKLIQLSG